MIINLYIYATMVTLTALLLSWILYKTEEELIDLKKAREKQMEYTLDVCRGCGDYYDNQIERYEKQISEDADLIDLLRKENWELKKNEW